MPHDMQEPATFLSPCTVSHRVLGVPDAVRHRYLLDVSVAPGQLNRRDRFALSGPVEQPDDV